MKQPKRPFIVEIRPSRSTARQKDRPSIWGALDLAGTARKIAEQDANSSPSGEAIPSERIASPGRDKS